jgi:hypothetical protein
LKIAFISANREKLPDPVVPLGLLYVMASVPETHEKVLWDLCFQKDPFTYTSRMLQEYRPDLIAVGMRNIQNNDYTGTGDNLAYYESIFKTIRSQTLSPVILGGSGFSVMPEKLMALLRPDYGISGEGEKSFASLVQHLSTGQGSLLEIPALYYYNGDTFKSNGRNETFQNLDLVPWPRRLVQAEYYPHGGIEPIQTKRGCALHCDYCTYPTIEGRQYRVRDPKLILDEMETVLSENTRIRHFFIVDSVFNIPRPHAKAICREMIRRHWKIPWTCYVNPLGFDEEMAELMAQANCAGMEVGSDSGSDEILERLRKGFTKKKIENLHRLSQMNGLKDCHTFILGTPGETWEHVEETLNFIIELNPFAAVLMAWISDEALLDPLESQKKKEFRQQLLNALDRAKHRYPRWVIPPLSVNFNEKLFRWLRGNQLTGPLWQHLDLVSPHVFA